MSLKLGGKKTALEAAIERRGRVELDPRRLVVALLIGVAAALAAACLWQASSVRHDAVVSNQVNVTRDWAAGETKKVLAALDVRVRAGLDDDEVRSLLANGGDESRALAAARIKQRLPEIVEVELYPPDLKEVMHSDLAKFGYVRADVLSDARPRAGVSRVQAQRDNSGIWRLAMARAIVQGDQVLAYAYLLMPLDRLTQVLSQGETGGGYLDLRQIMVRGYGVPLYLFPGANGTPASEDVVVEIPDSRLAIGGRGTQSFRIGSVISLVDSTNVPLLTVFGVVLLGIAGGLFYVLRKVLGERAWRPEPLVRLPMRELPFPGMGPVVPRDQGAEAAAPEKQAPRPVPVATAVERSIFRAYDIRGVVDKTLTPPVAKAIGQAIGTKAREMGLHDIVVARDGRNSGPMLSQALIEGLRGAGMDVVDIGAVPTPVLYFATFQLNTGSGVMVTGSHNPPEYNGFKIMLGGDTLAEDAIQDLYVRIAEGRLDTGLGSFRTQDVRQEYIERITGDIQVERRLKLVLDAGNGIAGAIAPQVLEGIGCDVVPLHCDVDGTFPNHHPDPSDPHNLQDLIVAVKQFGADVGMAFDGDGDRLGVVTQQGEIIYPDRLLMLFAQDVLMRNPGAAVIYDVKCSGRLQDVILSAGGSPIMWKTGHSLIKAKMKEVDAELAGEMSGHFFFRERWYGFDDGIYAAARLAEILAVSPLSSDEVFAEMPRGVSTPELKIQMEEGRQFAFLAKFREIASFPGARVTTIDGVRADYPQGWGLVRCSNTTPTLVLRFEGDDNPVLNHIQDEFRRQLLAVEPGLKLPF